MNILDAVHERFIKQRRVRALAAAVAPLLPPSARVLDIGSGDGRLSEEVQRRRPETIITGVDVLVRPGCRIPTTAFDGETVPFPDGTFDVVLLIDVLHHTDSPELLLKEALRVTRNIVIVKDHDASAPLARRTLRFMDGVGNTRFGVALPYNYLSWTEWNALFTRLNCSIISTRRTLRIYPTAIRWLFDRSLHFVCVLQPKGGGSRPRTTAKGAHREERLSST